MPHHISFTQIRMVEQPMLAAGIAFVSGELLAGALRIAPSCGLLLLIALWITTAAAIRANSKATKVASLLAFAASGLAIQTIETGTVDPARLKRQIERGVIDMEQPVRISGIVAAAPELASDRIFLEIEAERIEDRQVDRPCTGRIQFIVLFKDGDARNRFDEMRIDYGSRVIASCQLRESAGYRNPGVVSLKSILEQKGLDTSALLKGPDFIVPRGNGQRWSVPGVLYRLRARAISTLLRRVEQPASGLLVASMFGNHNFLDRRIAESFRAGGTFHLLVISGLHVALIAAAVLFLLKRSIRSRIARFSVAVLSLWAFAVMVGGQPAVTRAAAMISMAVLAQLILRPARGANLLGLAAILLLSWNPKDVYSPGFQLSFLTVLVMAIGTAPLYERLRAIGAWQPTEMTPHPPRCWWLIRAGAEVIFWSERNFRRELRESRIRFRLEKTRLSRLPLPDALSWVIRNSFATILTTLGIQFALLPLMVIYFHRVSLIAPVSNVIEAALLSLLMLGGLTLLAANLVNSQIAEAMGHGLSFAGNIVAAYSQSVDALPRASFRTPDYGEYSLLVYGAYFGIGIMWSWILSSWSPLSLRPLERTSRARVVGRIAMTLLTTLTMVVVWLAGVHPFGPRLERGRLTLTMLDVGQGDSLLVAFPGGSVMLLDSGGRLTFENGSRSDPTVFIEDRPGIGEMAVAPFLWNLGVRRLDYITASHSDADHVQGFVDIVPSFEIGTALRAPPVSATDAPFPASLDLRSRVTLARGDRLEIDGVQVDVMAPFHDMLSPRYSANDRSLVLKLRYGNIAFLLTGDIERRTEIRLLEAGDDLRANVLKVAHHGSRTSTTQAFLNAVKPSISLISAGSPSPFGHPHPDVMMRLEKSGVKVLRTSACGAITISTDGRSIAHRTYVRCE